jgi:hypothetical protein
LAGQSAFRKSGTCFFDKNALKSFKSRARLGDQAIPPDRIVLWERATGVLGLDIFRAKETR